MSKMTNEQFQIFLDMVIQILEDSKTTEEAIEKIKKLKKQKPHYKQYDFHKLVERVLAHPSSILQHRGGEKHNGYYGKEKDGATN